MDEVAVVEVVFISTTPEVSRCEREKWKGMGLTIVIERVSEIAVDVSAVTRC